MERQNPPALGFCVEMPVDDGTYPKSEDYHRDVIHFPHRNAHQPDQFQLVQQRRLIAVCPGKCQASYAAQWPGNSGRDFNGA